MGNPRPGDPVYRVFKTEERLKKAERLKEAALAKARQLDLFTWADIIDQEKESRIAEKIKRILGS